MTVDDRTSSPGSAAEPSEYVGHLQRRSVRSLAIAQIVGSIGVGVSPSVGVLLAEQVTASEVWAGLARTGSTLGAALAGVPLATLAMRRGRRTALSLGWSIAAVGAALLIAAAQWQSIPALVVGLVLTGAGTAAQLQARFAATDLAEPAHKGRALATVVWVGSIGSILGPNLGAPGEWLAGHLGLAPLAGAFVFAALAMAVAGVSVLALLRPDPLLTALRLSSAPQSAFGRDLADDVTDGVAAPAKGAAELTNATVAAGVAASVRPVRFPTIQVAIPLLRDSRATRTAFTAIISAQVVMVAIMTMTPVHLAAHGGSLTVVGVTISLHIVGMYGLAPLAGTVADRAGAPTGITVGLALFAGSFAVAVVGVGSAVVVTVSLVLLGLGWSFMGVAGASWLSSAVPAETRPAMQGFADTSSNVAAAIGAFLSGPLMSIVGFGGLSIAAAICLIPLCVFLLFLRPRPMLRGAESDQRCESSGR